MKRIFMSAGAAAGITGIVMLAVAAFGDNAGPAYAGGETPETTTEAGTGTAVAGTATVATGGTPTTAAGETATRTPGPLTPVSSPTSGTGGAQSTPAPTLPETGTGSDGGGLNWVAGIGILLLALGAGSAFAGLQRKS
jgi:hypothetical protein